MRWLFKRINIWVILGGVLVAGGLIALIGLVLFFSPSPVPLTDSGSMGFTIIPAPTLTVTQEKKVETPVPSPLPSFGGISVGDYVQITGTEGQGLRLRSGPGTSNPPRFLGMEAEVFLVKDGPKQSDGFTWWFLEAPYDPDRSGWAASSYLVMVRNPTVTP
jgi:hypothetical protein